MEKYLVNIVDKIFLLDKYFKNYSFNKTSEIKWVKYYNDIPEIKEKVNRIISKVPPKLGECYNYSKILSSSIEGVGMVFGLMLVDDLKKNLVLSHNPNKGKKNYWFSFDGCRFYIDNENNLWNTHCWNTYKGKQFDCMRDELYDNWVTYRKFHEVVLDFSSINEKISFRNFSIINMVTRGKMEQVEYIPKTIHLGLLNW